MICAGLPNATSEGRVAMVEPARQVVPQLVLSPLTSAAIFLVVTMRRVIHSHVPSRCAFSSSSACLGRFR